MKKKVIRAFGFIEKRLWKVFPWVGRTKRLELRLNELNDNLLFLISESVPIGKARPAIGALRELQKRDSRLLGELNSIFNKYGVKYFLTYGSLLGAIRHNGYIPWDDDMDIGMLREDYDRFLTILREDEYFAEFKVGFPFNAVKDADWLQLGAGDGAYVDIFPYDLVTAKARGVITKKRKSVRDQLRMMRFFVSPDLLQQKIKDKMQAFENDDSENRNENKRFLMPGLDACNISDVHAYEDIFPLKTAIFDSVETWVPHHPEKCLNTIYGEWNSYPNHIKPHHLHRLGNGEN